MLKNDLQEVFNNLKAIDNKELCLWKQALAGYIMHMNNMSL